VRNFDFGRREYGAIATFAVGALLIAAGTAFALDQAPPQLVRIGAPGVKALGPRGGAPLGTTDTGSTVCQPGEILPAKISAIRLSIWAFYGAPIHVTAYKGPTLLTQGSHNANWTGDSVTVPVKPLAHTSTGVRLCFEINPNQQPLQLLGPPTPQAQAARSLTASASPAHPSPAGERALPGRVVVEYLAPGRVSWFSQVLTLARHLGLGRAYSGTWIVLLVAALMAAVAVLAVRLTLRELR
jgi:hypothetical protein